MAAENLLQQLHDIHPPAAISSWPLAPGWYILLFLITVMIPTSIVLWLKRRRRQRYRRQTLALLTTLLQQHNLSQVNVLLKRLAIRRYGKSVGILQGQEWLAFLDKTSAQPTLAFQTALGAILLRATYQVHLTAQDQAHWPDLVPLITQWVQHHV